MAKGSDLLFCTETPNGVKVVVAFVAEETHSKEQHQGGWQAIVHNFKLQLESKQ